MQVLTNYHKSERHDEQNDDILFISDITSGRIPPRRRLTWILATQNA